MTGCLAGIAAARLPHLAVADDADQRSDWKTKITQAFARYGDAVDSPAWAAIRRLFPLDDKLTYFNSAGLGPSPHAVLDTIGD